MQEIEEINTLLKNAPKKEEIGFNEYKKERYNRWENRINELVNGLKNYQKGMENTLNAYEKELNRNKQLNSLFSAHETKDYDSIRLIIEKLHTATKPNFKKPLIALPESISAEVNADLEEIQNCLKANCYRSVTILCGRILETALHYKYYELTGRDILETSPGFGLGKLIAKLRELNYDFGPGLTEQIHLINQVRINSVHQKQNTFYTTKEQAEAMILYTTDVLKKLF